MISDRKMKEWQSRNSILQQVYHDYRTASTSKERDRALSQIQKSLEWNPFMNLCIDHSAQLFGISRYGLDSDTERCIEIIDKIANGDLEYDI